MTPTQLRKMRIELSLLRIRDFLSRPSTLELSEIEKKFNASKDFATALHVLGFIQEIQSVDNENKIKNYCWNGHVIERTTLREIAKIQKQICVFETTVLKTTRNKETILKEVNQFIQQLKKGKTK